MNLGLYIGSNDCDGIVDCDDSSCTSICGGLIGLSVYFDKEEQWLIMAYTEPSAGSYSVYLMVMDTEGNLVPVESIVGLTINPYKVADDAINQVVGLAFDSESRTAKISYIGASGMKLIQVPNISPPCAPDMEVTPASLLFNTVCTGSITIKTITICNNRNYPLNILSIAPPVAPYSISRNTCGSTVAPQACCEIDVRLSPSSANTYNSSVGIDTDDGFTTVGLSATAQGCGPKIQVTPNPLDFGSVKLYTTPTKTVTVSNTGGTNLSITMVGYPSNYFYKIQDNCASKTLAPGASCSISIMFYPWKVATFTSSFVINSNDVNVTVNLTGKGY